MGFWEENAKREAAAAPPPEPTSQNAPAHCFDCGLMKADTLLGVCASCFAS